MTCNNINSRIPDKAISALRDGSRVPFFPIIEYTGDMFEESKKVIYGKFSGRGRSLTLTIHDMTGLGTNPGTRDPFIYTGYCMTLY